MPESKRPLLERIACWFGFHTGGVVAHGSCMGHNGPHFLYQCKRCRRYFSEKWS